VRYHLALKPGEISERRQQDEKQDDHFRNHDDKKRMVGG